jgi:hypothetical protein
LLAGGDDAPINYLFSHCRALLHSLLRMLSHRH